MDSRRPGGPDGRNRLFKGSPKALVTSLVSGERVSDDEIEELSRVLEESAEDGGRG